MSRKVLIAYGTRFGSTEEISIKFKQILEKNNFVVNLVNLKAMKKRKPDISDYSGVLIGSGIRVARWTKEAKNFLKTNVNFINNKELIIGIYLSSGNASDPKERPTIIEKYLLEVFKELGLKLGENVLYDAFGGVFDLSKTTNLSWINRKMLMTVADGDPKIVPNERRDLRDWNQINNFIVNFIHKLR
ncbi:MAG: flavodoxin domain-containing protein [Candidatus Hodarchaeota archaeon]